MTQPEFRNMKHAVLAIAAHVAIAGCATPVVEPETQVSETAASIRIYRKSDPPAECEELGPVSASSGSLGLACVVGSLANAKASLRREADALGANAILLENTRLPNPQHLADATNHNICVTVSDIRYILDGIAFSCPDASHGGQ